jgi:putative hydrolase of the HAD superfamily
MAAEITYYRAHLNEGRDEPSLTALRSRCAEVVARELAQALGQDVPGGQPMVEVLLASLRFSAFADVGPALSQLGDLGLRLVVVSNWDVSLDGVLERLGISRWLAGVVTSAQGGVRKPGRAVFERGLAVVGVSAGRALHVGDSPDEDVEGARAAGIEPVLICRNAAAAVSSDPGRKVIRSLRDLAPLISTGHG